MLEEPPEQKQNKQQKTSANKKTTLKMTIGVYYLDYSSFKTSESVLNGYMCETGKKEARNVRSDMQNIYSSCLYVCVRGRWSQYFLPRLHIYVGGISLVNIGFYQTLKSLITFNRHCIILR